MHVLFVHQNCPAQFRHVAPALAERGWDCTFVTTNAKVSAGAGVRKILYQPVGAPRAGAEGLTGPFQAETAHARGVYEAMKGAKDVKPDLVVAHSGFGSSLFLPHLYDAPIVNFFEYYFRPGGIGQHLGYRPDAAVTEGGLLRLRLRNACFLLDLDNCDRGWCPNQSQRDTLPAEYQAKVEVIPEGIDTDFWKPGERSDGPRALPDGTVVPAGTRLVTYVARGLERMRGFDVFMRAAKRIYSRFPNVLFVVVGEDKAYYGNDQALTGGKPFREHVLAQNEYDLTKFRFTGRVPPEQLAALLGMSDLHVYLTEPFVTSWSLLDAMASGCVVLASDQACVREYVKDGENGLLADFFDADGLAERAVAVLSDPAAFRHLGEAARRTIVQQGYDLRHTLPRLEDFFRRTAAMPRGPSMRADLLVRPGVAPRPAVPVDRPEAGPDEAGESSETFSGAIPWRPDGAPAAAEGTFVANPSAWRDPVTAVDGRDRPAAPGVVLFCWELGAGLGHLSQIKALATDLVRRGHRVFVAASQLEAVESVLAGSGVAYLQAPHPLDKPRDGRPYKVTLSLAHVLANTGWASEAELFAMAGAWRNLFKLVRPDLIVFDHAPTALLASRGLPGRRATVGSGFCCPPHDEEPLPAFRPGGADPDALRADERALLEGVNRVVKRYGWSPLDRLADLYAEADETFLVTLPELDHYRDRRGAAYWGPTFGAGGEGKQVEWPGGGEPGGLASPDGTRRRRRVLAYLSRSPAAIDVLEALRDGGHPTLAHVRGIEPKLRKRLAGTTMRVSDRPLDLSRAARECDVAILNGGHGSTAQLLLAGKPVVLLPQFLEQNLTAEAVARLGVGEAIFPGAAGSAGETPGQRLRAIVSGDRLDGCARAAERFASRYGPFDVGRQREAMLRRAEQLIAAGQVRPSVRGPARPPVGAGA